MPNVITCNALISAREKGKQPEKALELFEAMKWHGIVSDVIIYNALISACEKGKQLEKALVLFDVMQLQGIWGICHSRISRERIWHGFPYLFF